MKYLAISSMKKKYEEVTSMQKKMLLGCVADDFTGASDAASFLEKAGMCTILLNEIPEQIIIPKETDAIVIALKSRTQEKEQAVKDVVDAVKWLEYQGATKFYFKYCSTFDSTKEGNIGPVSDAVMEYLGQKYTILCPALPINGRKVKKGNLFVNGVLLAESPMKNHPLTPMWDSRVKNLIEAQSRYRAMELFSEQLHMGKNALAEWLSENEKSEEHFYVIPDYVNDKDGEEIIRLFGNLRFLTGGSGILEPLAAWMLNYKKKSAEQSVQTEMEQYYPGVVFAGSCSVTTQEQVADYREKGKPAYQIRPKELLSGEQTKEEILNFVLEHPEEEVLIYSSDCADNVREIQKLGKEKIAALIEETISSVASDLMKAGYRCFVVAGGETSGAVTKALGFDAFHIGPSVAPGVPVMIPVADANMRLVLKSGNFGERDFFTKALWMTKGGK